MKRLLTLALAAIALGTIPASANPTASVDIRDQGAIGGSYYDGAISAGGQIFFSRTTTVDPSADPNSLFPIIVDPNDPPEPPASATSETLTVGGNLSICTFGVFACSYASFSDLTGSSLTFDDLPLAGNSVTWTTTAVATGGLGPQPMTMTLTAARPSYTGLDPFNGSQQVNPWIDGSDAHVSESSFTRLFARSQYIVTGSVQTTFGTFALVGSYAFFDRYLQTAASADATLPA